MKGRSSGGGLVGRLDPAMKGPAGRIGECGVVGEADEAAAAIDQRHAGHRPITAVEHHELTPWIRFGNRQSAHELATKAQGATTRFVEDAADPEQIDEEECPSPNL